MKNLLSGSLILLLSFTTQAEEPTPYGLGVEIGMGDFEIDKLANSSLNASRYKINFSYDYSRNYRVNVGYTSVGSEQSISGLLNLFVGSEYSADIIDVNIQRNFWFNDYFAAYANLGAQYYSYKIKAINSILDTPVGMNAFGDDSGLSYNYGIGLMYQVTPQHEYTLGYRKDDLGDLSTDAFTMGYSYHF